MTIGSQSTLYVCVSQMRAPSGWVVQEAAAITVLGTTGYSPPTSSSERSDVLDTRQMFPDPSAPRGNSYASTRVALRSGNP
jgi:hypothetical protein